MPGVIPKLRWERRAADTLALVIPASVASLYGERPAGRLAALAKFSGKKLEMVVEPA
jgi:exopolyphosphatase/guanosine-5'-triphosphate,3'-diphosphate pyrophosphatase